MNCDNLRVEYCKVCLKNVQIPEGSRLNMRHYKFTLVELLVVICIASLLMGLVIPAFSRMVTGSAVDRLASDLKLRLERAQSHAASSRRHVAVILPGNQSGFTADKEKAAKHGGVRACYVGDPDDADFKAAFKRWIPDEEWSSPERGAFLIYVTKDDPVEDETKIKAVFGDGTSKGNIARGMKEALTKETSEKDKPLKDIDDYNGTTGATVSNCAIIFSPKGGIRSAGDVYLIVHEAMKNRDTDGTFLFPGGGVEFNNYRILKIDRLTGKVRYHR